MPDQPDVPPEPAAAPSQTPPPEAPPAEADSNRRRFFRLFAGDVVSSVGSIIGVAQSLQAESATAARELLAFGDPTPLPSEQAVVRAAEIDARTAGYRAPYRWDVDACRIVDQRRLPDVITELALIGAADTVNAINDGSVIGSAVQAQVAAVTVALVAFAARTSRPFARRATIRGAASALRLTRPGSAAMGAALDRLLARLDLYDHEAEGNEIAAALRSEAEAIVFEATYDHGAVVEHGLAALPGEPDSPLHVLVAGSTGAMGGGQAGTALSIVMAAHHAGRPVHALVAESRPSFAGSRIAAWELSQAGVPYAVVTDAAAPGCIAEGEVAAVLVAADRVAANGDVIAPIGTYALALAAREAGVPLLVCAPTTAIDLATASGEEATIEEGRPSPVLHAGTTRIAPEGSQARNPVQDLTPASLVSVLVTEEGALRAPFGPGIADAVTSASARRATSPGFAALVRLAAEAETTRAANEAAANAAAANAAAATAGATGTGAEIAGAASDPAAPG